MWRELEDIYQHKHPLMKMNIRNNLLQQHGQHKQAKYKQIGL